jgi:inner membrane protein
VSQKDSNGRLLVKELITNIYLLPETLNIASEAVPQVLHRGIFDAVVYDSRIRINGQFSALELAKSGINTNNILWDKVKIDIGLSDLKGLKNNPSVKVGDTIHQLEPDFGTNELFTNNLVAVTNLSGTKNTAIPFSFDLDLRGSNDLNFVHLGKTTTVNLQGKWNNPSYSGRYLPDNRKSSATGFNASWKMPHFNRPLPQQWIEQRANLRKTSNEASFGVKFILPVDQYQKTMRSAKYAILIILLTFVSLFFTELIRKTTVHLLQYVLIGAAMTIYYTLLLSFTEQVGFTLAYVIASVATVSLVSFFIASLLQNRKAALLFGGILTLFYSFIYVIIQLQDLALLFGSIGLFVIVAALMYFSANIDWNKKTLPTTE